MLELIMSGLSTIAFLFKLLYAVVYACIEYPMGAVGILFFFYAVSQYEPEWGD